MRRVTPLVETLNVVNIRVITINVVSQEVMTRDKVVCSVDSVVFFKIINPDIAVLEVEEYQFAINSYHKQHSETFVVK